MANWYCASNKYANVPSWQPDTSYSVGDFVKQATQPSDWINRRVFRCTRAGTSGSSEPTWSLTKGSTTDEGEGKPEWTEVTGNSSYGWSAAGPTLRLFLNGASSWAAAGDTVYVNSAHSESTLYPQSDIVSPGTQTNPVYVLCVNDSLAPASGALITKDAWLYITGYAYCRGVNFTVKNAIITNCVIEEAVFTCVYGGITVGDVCFVNVTVKCQWSIAVATGSHFFRWRGGIVTNDPGYSTPVYLITLSGVHSYLTPHLELDGVDLSDVQGSNKYLLQAGGSYVLVLANCRLGAGVSMVTQAAASSYFSRFTLVNCDSGNTNYCFYRFMYSGEIFSETGVYRENGATDGTTPISRRIVSSQYALYNAPVVLDELVAWNETTGQQKTATVHLLTDGVTLTNKDCWAEVEYLGDADYPLSSFVTNKVHILDVGEELPSDDATWQHNLGNPVKQKIALSFTPQMKGPFRVSVYLAKPSTTVYVCPKVDVE